MARVLSSSPVLVVLVAHVFPASTAWRLRLLSIFRSTVRPLVQVSNDFPRPLEHTVFFFIHRVEHSFMFAD